MKFKNISLIKYKDEYIDGVVNLQKNFHSNLSHNQVKSDLMWFFHENPYKKELNLPTIFIAINEKNKVVGVRGFMILKYKFKSNIFYSLGPSGAYINENYRGIGLFNELNKFALRQLSTFKQIKTIINLSSNKYSTPGYIKLGWEPIQSKTYMHHINPIKYFKSLNPIIDCNYNVNGYNIELMGVEKLKSFNDISDLINYDKINLLRDEEYYQWRFGKPSVKTWIMKIYSGKTLVAYSIIKREKGKVLILEYFYKGVESFKILIRSIKEVISYKQISIFAIARPDVEKNALARMGFLHINYYISKLIRSELNPALIRPNIFTIDENDWRIFGKDIRDIKNWNFHYSDMDSI